MPDTPACLPPSPFWRKGLRELSPAEWESLCDGCGRCCLVKLEDEDTGEVYFTSVGCTLLDHRTCRCTDYAHRQQKVSDCLKLTPDLVETVPWLPPTCAYRLVREKRDLMWWHPLVSGTADTVKQAGVAVHGRVAGSEQDVPVADLQDYLVTWPTRVPRRAQAAPAGCCWPAQPSLRAS